MTDAPPSSIIIETPLIAAFDAHVLLDARLSMKAKGLAAILLSTGTWAGNEDISTDDLIALGTDGRDSILAGLRELEEAGYLTRSRRTGEGGRIYWQRTMRARPMTAKPDMDRAVTSLDTVSSDDSGRTNGGKAGHGDAPSTSGETTRTRNGNSGYGAAPDLTRVRARTEEEEELLDRSPSLGDNSSTPHSTPQSDRARDQAAASLDTVSSENEDPDLKRLCREMLVACGVRVAADHLYPAHSFEHIRSEAVRYRSEFTTDHQRERNAGVLVHRIRNGVYVPLSETERMSGDYLNWRTDAEREADRAALVERTYELPAPPSVPPAADPEPPTAGGWQPSAVWRQLLSELAIEQNGSFDRWVHDTWVIAYEDGEFLIGLPDAFRYDWIVHRLSKQIKRKLSVITGQTVDVQFRVQPRSLMPTAGVH